MLAQSRHVFLGGIPSAFISGVALYHRTGYSIHHGLPKIRAQEVLIALFTGMNLHRHISGQRNAQQFIQFQYLFAGNRF